MVHSRCLINRFRNKGVGKEKLSPARVGIGNSLVILGSDSIVYFQVAEAVVGGA